MPPVRGGAGHRPVVAVSRWRHQPSLPAVRDPDRRRPVHRSRSGGSAASGRLTSPQGHVPANRGRRCRVRLGGSAPALARWRRSSCKRAWGAWRITRKLAATYSSCSATSSPKKRSPPPQDGHASAAGRWTFSSRGRCLGSGCVQACCVVPGPFSGVAFTTSPSSACRFSSCSSSCSIWWSSFSDLRPNCMRRSLAIHSLRCSISVARVFNCQSYYLFIALLNATFACQ
ncbi:hypothetical protein JAB6_29450 [Janthinobacterium sp. HH104]|nr:hypothetical protein JAB6_29450 [Janthinobacterium sp. HH104]